MPTIANVNQLIASLEAFTTTLSSKTPETPGKDFETIFQAVSGDIDEDAIQTQSVSQPIINPAFSVPESGYSKLNQTELLVDSQINALSNKPNMREFMDATGAKASDASELLYGVIGNNADLRNWTKIMASDDPITSTRLATAALYTSEMPYELFNHDDYYAPVEGETVDVVALNRFENVLAESSLSSKTVISQTGNFAEIETDADTSTTMAVSSSGLLLRGAGSTQAQIERTAWLFGFDTEGLFA